MSKCPSIHLAYLIQGHGGLERHGTSWTSHQITAAVKLQCDLLQHHAIQNVKMSNNDPSLSRAKEKKSIFLWRSDQLYQGFHEASLRNTSSYILYMLMSVWLEADGQMCLLFGHLIVLKSVNCQKLTTFSFSYVLI